MEDRHEVTPQGGEMRRSIMICADDFGMTEGIDVAILELAEAGRLTATSCMVLGRRWLDDAPRLRRFDGRLDVGIHLTLTDYPALTGPSTLAPLGRLRSFAGLFQALAWRRVRVEDIEAEIDAQLGLFVRTFGRLPDYVDGHHHAHQYPGVARAVVRAVTAKAGWKPWVRTCVDRLRHIIARGIGLGQATSASMVGRKLHRLAQAANVPTNLGISGFYDVSASHRFEAIFPALLKCAGPRHLVFLHPGRCESDAERRHVWMRCREHEYDFLAGPGFVAALEDHGLALGRFSGST